jgi:hypothetical protein
MRITESQLRKIIREELLSEAGFGDVRDAERRKDLLFAARQEFEEWKKNEDVKIKHVYDPDYENNGSSGIVRKEIPAPYLTMKKLIKALPDIENTFNSGKFINIPEPERSQIVTGVSNIPAELDLRQFLTENVDSYWQRRLGALPSSELNVGDQSLNEALVDCLEPIFESMLWSYAKIINMMLRYPDGSPNSFNVHPGPFTRAGQNLPDVARFRQLLTMKDVSISATNVMAAGGKFIGKDPVKKPSSNFAAEMVYDLLDLLSDRIQTATNMKFSAALRK